MTNSIDIERIAVYASNRISQHQTLEQMQEDVFAVNLNTHKLSGDLSTRSILVKQKIVEEILSSDIKHG